MAPRYTSKSMSRWLLSTTLLCLSSHPVHALPSPSSPSSSNTSYTFLPTLPSPRQEHSVALLNSRLFVLGGITSNYSHTPDTLDVPSQPSPVDVVQSFDFETQMWTNHNALPIPFNHGNVATVGGQMYFLGGLLGVNMSLWGAVPNSYVYDKEQDEWSDIEPMPAGTERGASAVGVSRDEVFLAGGMRSLHIGPDGLQDSVTLVSSYNVQTNEWKTAYPPLPAARDHVGGAVVGRTFYVVGGRFNGQFNVGNNTWALNLDDVGAGWRELAPMPTARGGLALTAAGRCLYTFGGEGNPDSEFGVFDTVEVYDTKEDVWVELEPLWTGIHGTQAVYGGNEDCGIYIPGGGYSLGGAGASNFSVRVEVERWCFNE